MLSKKEIGMIALAGAGLLGVSYFTGAIGGGGQTGERIGKILGSPSGLPSTGTGSQKQIAAVTGYMAPGTKTAVTPEMRKEFGFVPSKTAYAGKQQVSPTFIPEAATQAYITQAGGYIAPTFNGVGGRIVNGSAYIAPAGLYPKSGGLTAKGIATKKKVEARKAGGFISYTGSYASPSGAGGRGTGTVKKGSAAAQKAAYKARKG